MANIKTNIHIKDDTDLTTDILATSNANRIDKETIGGKGEMDEGIVLQSASNIISTEAQKLVIERKLLSHIFGSSDMVIGGGGGLSYSIVKTSDYGEWEENRIYILLDDLEDIESLNSVWLNGECKGRTPQEVDDFLSNVFPCVFPIVFS